MSTPDRWLILQITRGRALQVRDAVRALAIDAFVPTEMVETRHRFDQCLRIAYQRPILGSYCFVGQPFDTDAISRTNLQARLMAFGERYMQVADSELRALQERVDQSSRVFWTPDAIEIAKALHQATIGVLPKRFLTLGAIQNMARAA